MGVRLSYVFSLLGCPSPSTPDTNCWGRWGDVGTLVREETLPCSGCSHSEAGMGETQIFTSFLIFK